MQIRNMKKAKLCLMDIHTLIFHIKTGHIYANIAEDIEKRFDTSNYELNG